MSDRSDKYLAAVADCLTLARVTSDPVTRVKLLTLAEKWYGLANGSAHANLHAALMAFNDRQLDPAGDTQSIVQQQQQSQPQPQQKAQAHAEVTQPPQTPKCPSCGNIMRLHGSSPATHYINLDQLRYFCDCGGAAEKTVAHRD